MGASLSGELHPAEPPPLLVSCIPRNLLPRPFLPHHGPHIAPRHSAPARSPSESPHFADNAPLGRPPPQTREIGLFPHISA